MHSPYTNTYRRDTYPNDPRDEETEPMECPIAMNTLTADGLLSAGTWKGLKLAGLVRKPRQTKQGGWAHYYKLEGGC